MYPSYKPREALDEYAIIFFTLLNEGYRKQVEHYLMLANIARLANATQKSADSFIRSLEYAAKDVNDIINPDEEGSSIEELKRALGG